MVTIQHLPGLDTPVKHAEDADGNITTAYARTGRGVAVVRKVSETTATRLPKHEGTVTEVLTAEGWAPIDVKVDRPETERDAWPDEWHLTWSRVWRYWITTPDGSLGGVRSFVAAAEAGGLPDDWTEQAAEGSDGTAHTVCSFTLTMDGARTLGAEQQALTALASLPGDVHFFQVVADIQGFSGIKKESRQPDTLASQLYAPKDLFQTSHPDAAQQRGSAFTQSDVLSITGLRLT